VGTKPTTHTLPIAREITVQHRGYRQMLFVLRKNRARHENLLVSVLPLLKRVIIVFFSSRITLQCFLSLPTCADNR